MTLRLEGRSVSGDQFRAASAHAIFAWDLLSFRRCSPSAPLVARVPLSSRLLDASDYRHDRSRTERRVSGRNARVSVLYTAELNGRATRTFDRTGLRRDPLSVAVGFDDRHGLAITDRLDDFSESEGHHGCFHPDLDTLVE